MNKNQVTLCSACLLGTPCAYDGKPRTNEKIIALSKKEMFIPICPEVLANLLTPRNPAEIYFADGIDIIDGKAHVYTKEREDVTLPFLRGAYRVLGIARSIESVRFIGKSRSPSCGVGQIYDGTFTKTLRDGDGVTSALLRSKGLTVLTEENI